ncbi:DUF6443 domain-containing protein [soil metagenome]
MMSNCHLIKKYGIIKGVLLVIFILSTLRINAQTYVSAPMTGTPAAGEYYNNSMIVVGNTPSFAFTASAGQSLHLYISSDCAPLLTNASLNQNYISTLVPRSSTGLTTQVTCELMQTIQYFDGFGRPLQTVEVKGSTNLNDLVQPYAYDAIGRETQKYLPYAITAGVSDGSYKQNALTQGAGLFNFYNPAATPAEQQQLPGGIPHISTPFAITVFDPSPINRITEQGAPGDIWQPNVTNADLSHTNRKSYTANDNTDITNIAATLKVMLYKVNIATDGTRSLLNAGTTAYDVNQLSVTIAKGENWQAADLRAGTVQEYKDKEGHVVLKRVFNKKPDNSLEMLSTYYVYDNFNNLCYVLPPGAFPDAGTVSHTTLDYLCYQYRYDERGRLIEKKLPGKGKEFIVYNTLNQPVMTQDANQRSTADQQWIVIKYDALGRPVVTGLYTDAGSTANSEYRAAMQTAVNSNLNLWETRITGGNGYNTLAGVYLAYPTTLNTTLSVNYYDGYDVPNLPATYDKHLDITVSTMTRGLPTASLIKILDGTSGSSNMLCNVSYYDEFGRNTWGFSQHFKGGLVSVNNYDEIKSTFDFSNALLTASRKNYVNNSGIPSLSVTVSNTYEYDHAGRKIKTWEDINGTKILLNQVVYNEIGQPVTKKLHSADMGQTFVQSVDYRYNSRGWLKSINNAALTNDGLINNDTNDAFGEEIFYDDYSTAVLKQYNGNISAVNWQSKVPSNSAVPQILQGYEYNYDRINRLTLANYTTTGLVGRYNEVLSYDVMGNILSLDRFRNIGNAATPIDRLIYAYENGTSSRIQSVTDNSGYDEGQLNGITTYANDVSGNLKSDDKKQLSFTYNYLNLPYIITKGASTITYIYDASGRKLRKVFSGANRDYVNGIEYDNGGLLNFIQTEEGRARPNGASYFYDYMLKDHLGNTKVMIQQDGVVSQQADYYPFGMEMNRGANVVTNPANKFKYNGKELQDELGINLYDYGARFYDPVIGRFTTGDPLAEKSRRFSPYAYGGLNPIRFIDVDGLYFDDYSLSKNGDVKLEKKTDDKTDRIVKTDSKGNVKTNSKGEAKTAIGGIEKGILKDGMNLKNNDNVVNVGGKGQPSVEGVKSFTLQLSEYIGKEIKGFSYSSNGSGNATDIVLGKYANNNYTTSHGSVTELIKKYGANFSFNNVLQDFHTHPDGKLGATESAPELSQDVMGMRSDKTQIPNASFIILYRTPGQTVPAEYDYTHN